VRRERGLRDEHLGPDTVLLVESGWCSSAPHAGFQGQIRRSGLDAAFGGEGRGEEVRVDDGEGRESAAAARAAGFGRPQVEDEVPGCVCEVPRRGVGGEVGWVVLEGVEGEHLLQGGGLEEEAFAD